MQLNGRKLENIEVIKITRENLSIPEYIKIRDDLQEELK